jgi:hypothetical protein
MSYDFELRGDDKYTSYVDFKQIHGFISALSHITENGSIGFTYEVNDNYYMEIDLELVQEDGEWLENENPDIINCIRMHIPYGYMKHQPVENAPYFDLCTVVAQYCGWHAIDLQTGQDLLESPDTSKRSYP